jgi:hypothetical protein
VAADAIDVFNNNIKKGTGRKINGIGPIKDEDISHNFKNLDKKLNSWVPTSIPAVNDSVFFKCKEKSK